MGRVHHAGDFRADGTEVFSHCASSDTVFTGVVVTAADSKEEDLEERLGPLDPKEIAVDSTGVTECCPMLELRGFCSSSGGNH